MSEPERLKPVRRNRYRNYRAVAGGLGLILILAAAGMVLACRQTSRAETVQLCGVALLGLYCIFLACRFHARIDLDRCWETLSIEPDALILAGGGREQRFGRAELVGYGMVTDPGNPEAWAFVFTVKGEKRPRRIYHKALEDPAAARKRLEAWCRSGSAVAPEIAG